MATTAGTSHCRIGEQKTGTDRFAPFYTMPETIQAAREFALQAGGPGDCNRVARWQALAEELEERELREFDCARAIFFATLVVNGQLFTGANAVARVTDQFEPESSGGFRVATAFCKKSKFAGCLRSQGGGEPGVTSFRADRMGASRFATAIQEARKPEEVAGICCGQRGFAFVEQGIYLAIESGEATQVHLVVFQNSGKRIGRGPAQVVKVELWNRGGSDILLTMPPESAGVENVALEFNEANRAEAELPERTSGME
jgi:hypothetical protein